MRHIKSQARLVRPRGGVRTRPHLPSRGAGPRRTGFTILEAAVVTVIVGVGAVALIELLAVGTVSNTCAAERTTAMHLVGNVREITLGLGFADPDVPGQWSTAEPNVTQFDDIKDLDGKTFSPPLNGRRQPIAKYAGWSQVISVDTVAEDYLTSVRPKDPAEPTARITVKILRDGREVYRKSWVATAPNPPWQSL